MTVDDVQALLGPGTPIEQRFVPQIVAPVNPADAVEADERARREGRSPPTARTYPTRFKYVAEGYTILKWENSRTGERIHVAFKNGIVVETHYRADSL